MFLTHDLLIPYYGKQLIISVWRIVIFFKSIVIKAGNHIIGIFLLLLCAIKPACDSEI